MMLVCLTCVFAMVLTPASASDGSEWWRCATIYEVYVRSFQDSDGDGIGDLKGVRMRTDYLRDIGVNAVWLTPYYPSPMADFGYDITNFIGIDPLFGTMDDFTALVTEIKKQGMKVVMDFVPNHTSDQHPWFQYSSNTSHPLHKDYRDFYVWAPGNGSIGGVPQPPNNWLSQFGGSAWTYNEDRKQFYFHQFATLQPDLNFRNPAVVGNMTDVLRFWMDNGIDGIRVDAAGLLIENASLASEPVIPDSGFKEDDARSLLHIYTQHQPETIKLLKQWGYVVKGMNQRDAHERFMITEIYTDGDMPQLMQYFGGTNNSELFPFNFFFVRNMNATFCKDVIDQWIANLPDGGLMSWVSGNHDERRVADKYGTEMVDAVNMIITVLPGMCVTYYGEEIGMDETLMRPDQIKDPSAFRGGKDRDPVRSPMQWDNSTNAGFTNNRVPWLPVNPNYWRLNVNNQKTYETSHLNIYKAMIKARQTPTLKIGGLKALNPNNYTLVIIRDFNSSYSVLVVNMGSEEQTYSPQSLLMDSGYSLEGISWFVFIGSRNSGYAKGTKLEYSSLTLTLRPKAAVLLVNWWSPPNPTPSAAYSNHFSLFLCLLSIVVINAR